MKKVFLLLLLACNASAQGVKPTGAWLPVQMRWEHAPPSVNPHLETATTTVLYFGDQKDFALIGCVVLRSPEYLTISQGDGQEIFRGEWDGHIPGYVRYRLVSRTVTLKGETLPGPWHKRNLALNPNGYLLFDGKLYRHVEALGASARRVADPPETNASQ